VVQELLDQHADIEGRIGKFETTPLQWAIWHKDLEATRLLLDRQASQDHINMRGWNTVFFCWSRLRNDEPCMLGFLNLLTADEQLDLDIQDERQWSVLDRVAAVGTVEELERLIELSANPHKEAMPLRWTAIHHAVFYGNFKTFNALLRRHEKAVHLTDERGWTLLHIAASAGHQDIVRRLLELGSDEQALSAAATEPELLARMPAILHGRQCTPREVAEAQGLENEQEYLLTVKEYYRANDTVEESEEFWEAQEKLEKGASGSE
jgi:ankyrin repeat protein